MKLHIYTDGGARHNPGPAAIGLIILDEHKNLLKKHKEFLGKKTNNQAEYLAVIKALEIAKALEHSKSQVLELHFFLDSELICRQLTGEYKINNPDLKELNHKAKLLEKSYSKVSYKNVPRENPFIQQADELVNEALDEH